MNAEEFDLFKNTMRCPDEGEAQGFYPAMPWNERTAVLWFKTLQRFPAAKVMRALELHVMLTPDHQPTLDAFLRDVKALVPPQPVPWQQFPQTTTQPLHPAANGYGAALHALLLPQDTNQAWAKCWIWLFEQELTFPGRESACAKQCRRFAEAYPRDREDWLRHAVRLEEDARETPQKQGRHDA